MENIKSDMGTIKPLFQSFNKMGRKWLNTVGNTSDRNLFEFTVVSYNVLADQLLHDHPWLYTFNQYNPWVSDWNYRKNNLLQEILHTKADILCLQEVQEEHFYNWFQPKLKEHGYKGVYKKRSGTKTDGCATFFKTEIFALENCCLIDYYKQDIPMMDRNNVAIVTILKPRKSRYISPIGIGNTHLLFNKNRGDIKLAQVAYLLAELDRIARTAGSKGQYLPIILCGDFNSVPYSPIYNFLTTGELKYQGLLKSSISGQISNPMSGGILEDELFPPSLGLSNQCKWMRKEKDGKIIETIDLEAPVGVLNHDHVFKSSYLHFDYNGSREITTFHDRAATTVDYIFYTPEINKKCKDPENERPWKLTLTGTLKLLTENEFGQFGKLPNAYVSSDHLLLMSGFSLSY